MRVASRGAMTTARTKGRANGDSSARADVEATEADEGASGGLRSLDRPFVILRVLRERRAPMRLT